MKYKSKDVQVGSFVECSNSFGISYIVEEKFDNHCTLVHNTGNLVMEGGKWVGEQYRYEDVEYSEITKVL